MQTIAARRRGSFGFTLVEMLVVIGILIVLAGLAIPATGALRRRSQIKECKAFIDLIAAAVEQYASDFGDFPPTSLSAFGLRTNRLNEGSKSLVRCLTTTEREGPYFEFPEGRLGTLSGDRLQTRDDPTRSTMQTPTLFEILDPWGNPLIYYHHQDYRGGREIERYTIQDEQQRCVPQPSEKTGQLPGFGRFLIWSAGPDGVNENGQGDDVCSWK